MSISYSQSTPSGTVSGMSPAETKALTNRLRDAARRRGFVIRKSRRRDPLALDYGWELRDADTNKLLVGNPRRGFGASLSDIEQYLSTTNPGEVRDHECADGGPDLPVGQAPDEDPR